MKIYILKNKYNGKIISAYNTKEKAISALTYLIENIKIKLYTIEEINLND